MTLMSDTLRNLSTDGIEVRGDREKGLEAITKRLLKRKERCPGLGQGQRFPGRGQVLEVQEAERCTDDADEERGRKPGC